MGSVRAAGMAAFAALALGAPAAQATTLVGVAKGDKLVAFDSAAPGDARAIEIKGFGEGEAVEGLDVRSATGELYALTDAARLYRVDLEERTATVVRVDPFGALVGDAFGFDFNPTVDRIRINSDAEQNLRAHPDTGALAATDGPLAYAATDVNAGQDPSVVGAAYTNPDNDPATGTTLYDIDSAQDVLVTQVPPNAGTLNTVGPLGVDVGARAGFDITRDGTAYAALLPAGAKRSVLYTADLATGALTPVGAIGGPKPLAALAAIE